MKSWAKSQAVVATSSGGAEYYGLAKVAAEAIGFKSLAQDLGLEIGVRLWVDSSAAKAVATRVGAEKMRHVEVTYLWVQELVQAKKIKVCKVKGMNNPADMLTKPKHIKEIEQILQKVGAATRTTALW